MAKLAGIPGPVLKAAQEKLRELELTVPGQASSDNAAADLSAQNDLFSLAQPHPSLELLKAMELDDLSPRQALEKLYELKSLLD